MRCVSGWRPRPEEIAHTETAPVADRGRFNGVDFVQRGGSWGSAFGPGWRENAEPCPLFPLFRCLRGRQFVILELFAQRHLVDLAGGAERDGFYELNVVRRPPLGDLTFKELQHAFLRRLRARLRLNDQQRTFIPLRMRDADDGGVGDAFGAHGDVFDVNRAYPLAAGLDDVLGAVSDLHDAERIYGGDVAGV